jgi:hypothetical protein
MLGYDAIPGQWREGIPGLADRKFSYTDYSFTDIVASTIARAGKVAQAAGGRLTATELVVPVQQPQPPALEQWDMGIPDRRVPVTDRAWEWKGSWGSPPPDAKGPVAQERQSAAAGDEAVFTFTGSAVAIVGSMRQDGGRADVYLDGTPAGEIDAYIPPNTHDNALWHAYDLQPGRHTVRIVTRGDKAAASTGTRIGLAEAITFRPAAATAGK